MSVASTRIGGTVTVTTERSVDPETAELLWDLYCLSFESLAQRAAARQLLSRPDFDLEVLDARVSKYLARTEQGQIVGVCTLSDDLETVPWISPEFYQARYPDCYARRAVFYCGIALVHPAARSTPAFLQMVSAMGGAVAAAGGVLAADMCRFNIDVVELTGTVTSVLKRTWGSASLVELDTQTYLAWEPHDGIPRPRRPARGACRSGVDGHEG